MKKHEALIDWQVTSGDALFMGAANDSVLPIDAMAAIQRDIENNSGPDNMTITITFRRQLKEKV